MKRMTNAKRFLSLLLAAVMVVGMVPAIAPVEAEAATTAAEFVSLPITIRDYAADGMLFDFYSGEYGNMGDVEVRRSSSVTPDAEVVYTNEPNFTGVFPTATNYTGPQMNAAGTAYLYNGFFRFISGSSNTISWLDQTSWDSTSVDGNLVLPIVSSSNKTLNYCVITYRAETAPVEGATPMISDWAVNVQKSSLNVVAGKFVTELIPLYGSTTGGWLYIKPGLAAGSYFDIADTALFESEEDAQQYMDELVIYNRGNNQTFGLLGPNTQTILQDDYMTEAAVRNYMNSMLTDATYTGTSGTITLKNGVDGKENTVQTLTTGQLRYGLVNPVLGDGKQLIYQESTVVYLADLLKRTLAIPQIDDNTGLYNMNYVMGTKLFDDNNVYVGYVSSATKDLAGVLREILTGAEVGDFATAQKRFNGEITGETLANITDCKTYMDAAYFLLHSLFDTNIESGYGTEAGINYKSLQLNKVGNEYVFDSDDAVVYSNVAGTGKIYNDSDDASADTVAVFDPVENVGYGKTSSPYVDIMQDQNQLLDSNGIGYTSTNYNYTMEGHAQFIYYQDDNLYFTFEGDDDVYLFINDHLVLDIGAAHGNTGVTVNINDVAALCGLSDGEAYDFDFYYMERHGKAAHFSIRTNIQIVDPSMLTAKSAYQDGVEVGYNGFVDPNEAVNYSFELTNNGEATITQMEFRDDDIGVNLTPATISLNSETAYGDLLAVVYHTDGTYTYYNRGEVTEDILKGLLSTGLKVGETIRIHGFKYTIPDSKWVADGSEYVFNNTVYTTGSVVDAANNKTGEVLNGIASCRVRKAEYTFAGNHYYDWAKLDTDGTIIDPANDGNNKVTLNESELLALVNDGESQNGTKIDEISSITSLIVCSPSGGNTGNINPNVEVSGSSLTYTAQKTGVDTFYIKINNYGPIRVTVFTYGTTDNVYVLDYSLPVELNGNSFGLTVNDVVYLADNNFGTTATVTGISNPTSVYGDFTYTASGATTAEESGLFGGASLKYTMDQFMSGEDSVTVTVQVLEDGASSVTKETGVTMTQTIKVAPASVVYYEDDFVDITYVNTSDADGNGNVWAEYVANGHTGREEQSADQDSNYGSDPNYSTDNWGTLTLDETEMKNSILSGLSTITGELYNNLSAEEKAVVDAIFAKLMERYGETLGGTASNGTIHELILQPGATNSEIMYFDFQGTGFELISRATQDLYAVLTVRVTEVDEDGNAADYNNDGTTTTKVVPVITESEGGDVYEVPIIKIDGLPYSHYKVTLSASNSGSANREIYIDGIRIYNPLGDGDLEDVYYSSDEVDAVFSEIRPLIVTDKKIVYIDVNNGTVTWGTGTTVVEDIDNDTTDSTFQVATSETAEYLNIGPNNEIYLDATADGITGGTNASVLAFYVTKDSTVADENRTLQIGAHRKIDTDQVTNVTDGVSETEAGAVYFVYGSTAADIADGIEVDGTTVNYLAIASGTEQYITIDPANLDFDESGKALVLVGTLGGENAAANVLALTNLKISGYTLTACGEEMVNAVNGTSAASNDLIQTGWSLRSRLAAPVEDETPEETTPEETTPEETTPEVTEPEVTEPEVTEPEETEPEVTEPEETEPEVTEPEEEELEVKTAFFSSKRIRSGSKAVLTVSTTENAENLLILDEFGNEVEYEVVSVVRSSDIAGKGFFGKLFGALTGNMFDNTATFTLSMRITGKSGEVRFFTIQAVDAEGNVSDGSVSAAITVR